MPLLTSSCPFGLGGLNCGNREYPQVENWDWVGPGQLRASSSLHCVLKSWAGCVRKTERKARMALSQPQILRGEINTCAQLHLYSEHDESGLRWEARKSPHLKENPGHSGIFPENHGIGHGTTLGRLRGGVRVKRMSQGRKTIQDPFKVLGQPQMRGVLGPVCKWMCPNYGREKGLVVQH